MSQLKVVVTGGAGFIGSHLVDALIKQGHAVVVLDNLSSGNRDYVNPLAEFYERDIRSLNVAGHFFRGVDCVYHLAAKARVPVSIADPVGTHDINVNGTLQVLEAARHAKVRRVVFASSSSVYGDKDPKCLPVHEKDSLHPKSPYGLQKLMGEQYCAMYSRLYDLPTICMRFFNVYGPRFDPTGDYALVIGKFITKRLKGEPLTVTGDGTQTRDFTHVSDVVRACMRAAEAQRIGLNNPGRGEAYNIGAGNPVSINWIANAIGGPGYPIKHIVARDEPKATHAYNHKAASYLGWRPTKTIEEGIAELKWFHDLS